MMPVDAAPASSKRPLASWGVFILLMIGGAVFEYRTKSRLTRMVAVHFDEAGLTTSFVSSSRCRIARSLSLVRPPQLSNGTMLFGLSVLLGCMVVWIGTLMLAFRRRG